MTSDLFLRLVVGHLIGDFVLQPFWLALAKRKGWKGLLLHVSVVAVVSGALVWKVIPHWLWLVGVLFVVHIFIDQFRTFVFVDNSNGKSFFLFLADQFVHLASLAALSLLFGGEPLAGLPGLLPSLPLTPVQGRLLLLALIIVLVWVTPILEVEFLVALLAWRHTTDTQQLVPITPADRLIGGLERLAALALVPLHLVFLMPVAFGPRLLWLSRHTPHNGRLAVWAKEGMSLLVTGLIGAMVWATGLLEYL